MISSSVCHGFSLIETAILLVIVTLIIGSMFVARTVIENSQMRGLVAQLEQVDGAVQAFKTRYRCMPGDCVNATRYFPLKTNNCIHTNGASETNRTCNGDGGGFVNSTSGGSPTTRREKYLFWQHLNLARLINGTYTGISGAGASNGHSVIGSNVPRTPLDAVGMDVSYQDGDAWSVVLGASRGRIYHLNLGATRGTGELSYGSLPTFIARSIDRKIDDGLASTGRFGAYGAASVYNTTGCVSGSGPSQTYLTSNSGFCVGVAFFSW